MQHNGHYEADWSPDGRRILFVAETTEDAPSTVYSVQPDGLDLRTELTDGSHYTCPTWLPGTDAFLLTDPQMDGTSRVVMVARSRDTPSVVLASDTLWIHCAAPSPDGASVLLTAGPKFTPQTSVPRLNIYVMRLDGSGFRALTTGTAVTNYGRWSPDGRRIVFQSNRHIRGAPSRPAALDSLEIYVMNRDGSRIRRLTFNSRFDAHPSW